MPVLVVAVLAAWWLYFRNRDYDEWPAALFQGLRALRFLLIFLLLALLIKPIYEIVRAHYQKPILAMVMDNSASLGKDSASLAAFLVQWQETANRLSDLYEVRQYTFGDKLNEGSTPDFQERYTDFSSLLSGLNDRLYNRHVGAVVVASDGIYNRGMNPEFSPWKLDAPLHTVALGDTATKTDLAVSKVLHNNLVFLGNDFTLQAHINARKANGNRVSVTLLHGGQVLQQDEWEIRGQVDFADIAFTAPAENAGIQKYTVVVETLEGEENTQNNRYDFYVDVLDSRIRILILANAPHPDLHALNAAVSQNEQYEVELALASVFSGELSDYNLVILHNLPSTSEPLQQKIQAAVNADIPMWLVVGSQTDFAMLKPGFPWMGFRAARKGFSDLLPSGNDQFNLFALDAQGRSWSGFPPLYAPFADYNIAAQHQPLLVQRIGNVTTEMPLWTFISGQGAKYAVTVGEGLWQWRMHDYQRYGNQQFFDQLVSKTAQYLALRVNKDRFQVDAPKKVAENEQVLFRAEVYNESFELDNSPEVGLTVTDTSGKEYTFNFDRTGNGYRLETGSLQPGDYQWKAVVSLDGKAMANTGEFAVEPVRVEFETDVANHAMLANLAAVNNGEMYYPSQLGEMANTLENSDLTASKVYDQSESRPLVDWKWLFFILLALVSTEWFLRKRHGYY